MARLARDGEGGESGKSGEGGEGGHGQLGDVNLQFWAIRVPSATSHFTTMPSHPSGIPYSYHPRKLPLHVIPLVRVADAGSGLGGLWDGIATHSCACRQLCCRRIAWCACSSRIVGRSDCGVVALGSGLVAQPCRDPKADFFVLYLFF
uniref:Uncharacterized protein n=1 Tax=Haptolina ericina TaxID=156174 RepID=A0A7S3AII9_9EUKA